jgi:hypothetical protein
MTEPKWKRFEKLIHQIHQQFGKDNVTLDERLPGFDSKTDRQIDVVIRGVVNQYAILVVVECRDKERPTDVGEVEAFVSKIRDVRANKGVMISTSGFTTAAVEMARTHAITTRTYLDTENVDWKTEVSIPVLMSYTKIDSIGTHFSSVPFKPMALPTATSAGLIKTFSVDGTPLGPVIVLLGKRWMHDNALHKPGEHKFVLAEDVMLESPMGRHHAKISITLLVSEHHYLGPLSISVVGFRDEQEDSITAQEIKTDFLDPTKIMNGELPGWKEIVDGEKIECFLRIGVSQTLPETVEEFEEMRSKTNPGSTDKM